MNNLAAALDIASQGIPIFPCEPGGKAPLGVCVPRGFKDATVDVEHVHRWWTRYPAANVAAPTGTGTFDVLDVDVEPTGSGYPAFNYLKRAGLIPDPVAIVATPRGGMHGQFAGSAQTCGRLAAHHLDFKASGGYVLLPPSEVNGRPYRYVHQGSGGGMLNWGAVKALLDPPRRATDQPSPRRRESGYGITGLSAWLSTRTDRRNESLFWACCRAVENGALESDLDELVRVALTLPGDHDFTEREALRTVRSALKTARRSA